MRGSKSLAVVLSAFVAFTFVACDDHPTEPEAQATFAKKSPVENNGAPSGPHYNLNLIGVSDKSADMTGNKGHRIFVKLWGNTKIWLTEGDFEVLDANGTDGDGASFQLPNPDPDCDGVTEYSVYVRALGTPNGSATMQSCYKDGSEIFCAVTFADGVVPVELARGNGKSVFTNVSKDLLYVDVCMDWLDDIVGGTCLRVGQVPLFGDDNYEYLWDYENRGLRIAQLRFYEIPTDTGWSPEGNQCLS